MKFKIFRIFLVLFLSIFYSHLYAADCYNATVVSPRPFLGNKNELVTLSDGSMWQLTDGYNYFYNYNKPEVTICPEIKKMIVKEKEIKIEKVTNTQKNDDLGFKKPKQELTTIQIGYDENHCVTKSLSMDVTVLVGNEKFEFDPSCPFSSDDDFTTKTGLECEFHAGMCSPFSPKNRIEVSCNDGSKASVRVNCPEKN